MLTEAVGAAMAKAARKGVRRVVSCILRVVVLVVLRIVVLRLWRIVVKMIRKDK
jgi:hypothetical protein